MGNYYDKIEKNVIMMMVVHDIIVSLQQNSKPLYIGKKNGTYLRLHRKQIALFL